MTGQMTHDELLEHLMQAWHDLDEANKTIEKLEQELRDTKTMP